MQDLEQFREFGHKVFDILIDYLKELESKPAWTERDEETIEITKKVIESLPEKGGYLDFLNFFLDFLKNYILPFNQGNIHPRYYAWIQGSGTPLGAIADFIASFLNLNVSIGNHIGRDIDAQVVEWSKTLFNFPKSSSGLLVSGSSMANLTAITAAIYDYNARYPGKKDKFRAYTSKETHKCIHRALKAINGDLACLKEIETNNNFEINCDLLEKQIISDAKFGYEPFLIIGNFGTVNTGAIDSLSDLIKIKNKHKLWLHIDGAYGAPALLTKQLKHNFELFSKVDSLAFDFHKLFNINYAAGCFLIQKKEILTKVFKIENQPYLMNDLKNGIAGGLPATDSLGYEVSRPFNALKVWMTFKYYGLQDITEMIESRIDLAKYLENQIKKNHSSTLKLISPVIISIVCFKFVKKGYSIHQLNELNKSIVLNIQKTGKAVPSTTVVNNEVVIRVSIINYKTNTIHIDDLLNQIIETGNKLVQSNKL